MVALIQASESKLTYVHLDSDLKHLLDTFTKAAQQNEDYKEVLLELFRHFKLDQDAPLENNHWELPKRFVLIVER